MWDNKSAVELNKLLLNNVYLKNGTIRNKTYHEWGFRRESQNFRTSR